MEQWIKWAIELQSIAQAGLTYTEGKFDKERYERIREISAEILSRKSELTLETVKDLFCNEIGYQTPKIVTRAAIFKNNKILLVQEADSGKWSLPGGWMDVDQSVRSNIIKEVKEEAGLDVVPNRLIAVHDRKKHNVHKYVYGICQMFVLCDIIGGEFEPNIETSNSAFFDIDNLPSMSNKGNSESQIQMCFDAYLDENWKVIFD